MRRLHVPPLMRTVALLFVVTSSATAQRTPKGRKTVPVRLSTVIAAFLADSGVPTRGLPWTTGASLPITWATPNAEPATGEYARRKGWTLSWSGTFTGTIGDTVVLPMTVQAYGGPQGLARAGFGIASLEVTNKGGGGFFATREMVETALRNEGLTFQPLRCSRDKEGASYGNLVDAVKAPGKTASGLWWMWQSPQQMMELSLTILYRRVDMAEVECQSG